MEGPEQLPEELNGDEGGVEDITNLLESAKSRLLRLRSKAEELKSNYGDVKCHLIDLAAEKIEELINNPDVANIFLFLGAGGMMGGTVLSMDSSSGVYLNLALAGSLSSIIWALLWWWQGERQKEEEWRLLSEEANRED